MDEYLDRIRGALDRFGRHERAKADAAAKATARRADGDARPRKHEEANAQAAILRALRCLPWVWCSRNTVGTGQYASGGVVQYGLGKGSADILCVVAPHGRSVWLEVKSATGRVRPEQIAFGKRQQALGALYCVVRTVDEALAAVEEARR